MPVLPRLIEDVSGADLADASLLAGWLFFAYGGMQFLCGPLLGNLSDAYGRRPILLLSVFGLAVDYLLTAFAPNMLWLFVGRTLRRPVRRVLHDSQCLSRRHYKTGRPRQGLWIYGGGFWPGLYHRPGNRRNSWRIRPARAFLCRRWHFNSEFCLWLFCPAGNPSPRIAEALQFGPLQSIGVFKVFSTYKQVASAVHCHGDVFLRHVGLSGDLGILGHCPLQLE